MFTLYTNHKNTKLIFILFVYRYFFFPSTQHTKKILVFIFLINWFDFSRLKFKTNCILLWKYKRFHRIRVFDIRMSFIEKMKKKKIKACCFSSPGLCNLLYNLNGLMMHIIYFEITICIYVCKISYGDISEYVHMRDENELSLLKEGWSVKIYFFEQYVCYIYIFFIFVYHT